jgi:ATP-dependent Lon protease
MTDNDNMQSLPVVPLKNSVLFPNLLMPLSVGRPASLAAVEAALATEEKEIVIVAQREAAVDNPGVATSTLSGRAPSSAK